MEGRMDGWNEERKDGSVDGWMEGWKNPIWDSPCAPRYQGMAVTLIDRPGFCLHPTL